MQREIRQRIGSEIKKLRQRKGLTQAQLSEISHIKYKYIQTIEGKNPPNIRIDTLERISKSLGTPSWKILKSAH
ncbi:MAG TPA: helix-turn-helix transcriptional regulator [Candidatus Omnitrophota bacterium]|nr:helix-turn-helix transcriptional regulator [Candidatus Omnitrophota bacterium]